MAESREFDTIGGGAQKHALEAGIGAPPQPLYIIVSAIIFHHSHFLCSIFHQNAQTVRLNAKRVVKRN
jgi:hypothetical protein